MTTSPRWPFAVVAAAVAVSWSLLHRHWTSFLFSTNDLGFHRVVVRACVREWVGVNVCELLLCGPYTVLLSEPSNCCPARGGVFDFHGGRGVE